MPLAVSLKKKLKEYYDRYCMYKFSKKMDKLNDLLNERNKYVGSIYRQIENESKILKDAAFSIFEKHLLDKNFKPIIVEKHIHYSDDNLSTELLELNDRELVFKTNQPKDIEVTIKFKTVDNLEDKYKKIPPEFDTITEKNKFLENEISELKIIYKKGIRTINTSYVCTMTPLKKDMYGESKPLTHKSRNFKDVIKFIQDNTVLK